jgi:hypothetical protein
MILSGSTTTAGTGAFSSAQITRGGDLQVWTTCVAASRLQGATTASVTVRPNQTSSWRYYTKQATCPDGTVAYGGGGSVGWVAAATIGRFVPALLSARMAWNTSPALMDSTMAGVPPSSRWVGSSR